MLISLAICASVTLQAIPPKALWIPANNHDLQYQGRVGQTSHENVTFYYAGNLMKFRFRGTDLAVRFKEDQYGPANSFGFKIDGSPEIPLQLVAGTAQNYVVAVGLKNKIHEVVMYRRTDTYGGVATFDGLWLNKGAQLLSPPPMPTRKIECFGDSVMGGTNSIAFGYEAQPDASLDYYNDNAFLIDGYWGFGYIAARKLRAVANVQGIGGLSLLNHTGWFGGDLKNTVGWQTTWNKLDPLPGQFTQWDFSKFVPDVVIISIGQNDWRGGHLNDPAWRKLWRSTYLGIVNNLHRYYPKALFVFTTTILGHDLRFDDMLKVIAQKFNTEHNDHLASYLAFKNVGRGTPGHPRQLEQEEMGNELANYLIHLHGLWGH